MPKQEKLKLGVIPFAFASGICWSLSVLFMGWLAWLCHLGEPMVEVIGSFYVGYSATFWGAVLGGLYALADGFIGGLILAWIYNCCAGKCK